MMSDAWLDHWLTGRRVALIGDIERLLDVEGGLREALLAEPHAALVKDLRSTLDVEAGLVAILPAQGPPVAHEPSDARSATQDSSENDIHLTTGAAKLLSPAPAEADLDARSWPGANWGERLDAHVGEVPGPDEGDGDDVREPADERKMAGKIDGEIELDETRPLDSGLFGVQRARRRWRVVAVAAVIVLLSGLVFAGLRRPLGGDLRTRPGDDPVSVAEPDDSSSSNDVNVGDPLAEGPDQNFGPDVEPSTDLGLGGESTGGVATTEVPSDTAPQILAEPDPADQGQDCDHETECLIDAAEQCDADTDCLEAVAAECGYDDPGCRGGVANTCGDDEECRSAVWNFRPRHHRNG